MQAQINLLWKTNKSPTAPSIFPIICMGFKHENSKQRSEYYIVCDQITSLHKGIHSSDNFAASLPNLSQFPFANKP